MPDLLNGTVSMMLDGTNNTLPYVQWGEVKALAGSSERRLPQLPDVPTFKEQSLQDYEAYTWHMVLMPMVARCRPRGSDKMPDLSAFIDHRALAARTGRTLLPLAQLGLLVLLQGCAVAAGHAERRYNRVDPVAATDRPAPPPEHLALHRQLFVADLHADTLLWGRDALRRAARGHADLPRLREGGVDLQIFAVPTNSPPERPAPGRPDDYCVSVEDRNLIGPLSVVQTWPVATWFDLRERALHQARRLMDLEARSRDPARRGDAPELVLVRTAADLQRVVEASAGGEPVLGAVLGLEGAHWIGGPGTTEDEVRARVRELFEAGFRLFAPTHQFDNALAGSSEGCVAGGLTRHGEVALLEAERLGMTVDLAHISPIALRDALRVLREPMAVSHAGVQAGCEPPCRRPRNLSDDDLRAVARHGGVIGVGFWPEAVGAGGVAAILRVMAHVLEALREPAFLAEARRADPAFEPSTHLAFGSDFDGAVTAPFDATGLPALTHAMLDGTPGLRPFSPEEVRRIAGLNVCRLLARRLPGGGVAAARKVCDSAARASLRPDVVGPPDQP
ncbi:Zn-dependent dipeptidase, dipeptidase homolog [Belnapia rosea]|nr:Zn-dependent dipeptidase, dipeptidase homolog [Belnapia rosea]